MTITTYAPHPSQLRRLYMEQADLRDTRQIARRTRKLMRKIMNYEGGNHEYRQVQRNNPR